jgi:DNA-binding IclR family transcriptional regulator
MRRGIEFSPTRTGRNEWLSDMGPLDKIFLVIESVISRQREGASFSQVQGDTGLAAATVHRHLKALTALGYMTYSEGERRYRGSLKMAGLGAEIMSNFSLRDHVHPFLLSMNKESDFASNAGIMDGREGVYIDKVDTQDSGLRLIGAVGKRFKLHCTGMGKVLLAHRSSSEIEQVLAGPLPSFTPATLTDPDKLRQELAEVRKEGYALDREEITRGIFCVAAPVMGAAGEVACALSVAFPSYVVSENRLDSIIKMVKRYAAECSGVEV